MDSQKNKEEESIDISDLVCLIFQYLEIIDDLAEKIKLGTYENITYPKEINDSFTTLDYVSQKLFNTLIEQYNKNILIIGEETITPEFDNKIINKNFTEYFSKIKNLNCNEQTKKLFNIPNLNKISPKKLSIFIDPIDCTRQLIKKNYEPVTVMIGICIDKKPFIGFIHYVFKIDGIHDKETYFNLNDDGIYIYKNKNYSKYNFVLNDDNNFVISRSRSANYMEKFIENFPNFKIFSAHGLGNKVIKCIKEDLIYFSSGIGSLGIWDICAACCLLKGMGIKAVYFNGDEIVFEPKKYDVPDDIMVCFNKNKLKYFIEMKNKYFKRE